MTIHVYEAAQGRDGVGGDSVTISFICIGTDNELTAHRAAKDHIAPRNADLTTYDGKPLKTLQVEERIAPNAFRVQATYSSAEGKGEKGEDMSDTNGGEWSFSFDGGGTTAIRTRSIETRAAYGFMKPGVVAQNDDHSGLIDNDLHTGETKGIEVPIPSLKLSVTMQMPHSSVNPDWINKVSDLVGCVNDRKLGPWKKGELLLLQPQGSQSSKGDVSVTYNFSLARKRTIPKRTIYEANVFPGGNEKLEMPVITVPPHHAVWYMMSAPQLVSRTNKKQRFPIAAYVERIYEYEDFRILGI